jgi:uncharacterized protein GlcG (DUF336 family)
MSDEDVRRRSRRWHAQTFSARQFLPYRRGVPLYDDGKSVGAIGVSGAKADQDGVIATAGAEALSV